MALQVIRTRVEEMVAKCPSSIMLPLNTLGESGSVLRWKAMGVRMDLGSMGHRG